MNEQALIHRLTAENLELRSRMDGLRDEVGIPAARLRDRQLTDVNQSWGRLFGFNSAGGLVGGEFLDHVVPNDRERIKLALSRMERAVPSSELLVFEAFRADGSTMGVRLNAQSQNDDSGVEIELYGHASQRGDDRNPLVLGRLRLSRELAAWAHNHDGDGVIARLSIQAFDELERRVGYADAALVADETEYRIRQQLRPGDRCFRFALSSYVLLLRGDQSEGDENVRRICKATAAEHFHTRRDTARVTLAAASNPLPRRILPETVLRDLCNTPLQYELAEPETTAPGDWPARIDAALDNDRLKLSYLPVRSLIGAQCNYEVLVSLVGEDGVEHPLREFDLHASDGQMSRIDRSVIEKLVGTLFWRQEPGPKLFVKLSAESVLGGGALLNWLSARCADRPDLCRQLVFEIAEATVIENSDAAVDLADELKIRGFEISLFRARGENVDRVQAMPLDWIRLDPGCAMPLLGEMQVPRAMDDLLEFAQKNHIRLSAPRIDAARGLARLWRFGVTFMDADAIYTQETIVNADT